MDTPLVIDSEHAVRLASALSALTGESLSAAIVAALDDKLKREREARERQEAQHLARAIAINARQQGRHLACVPDHGWCRTPEGLPR